MSAQCIWRAPDEAGRARTTSSRPGFSATNADVSCRRQFFALQSAARAIKIKLLEFWIEKGDPN